MGIYQVSRFSYGPERVITAEDIARFKAHLYKLQQAAELRRVSEAIVLFGDLELCDGKYTVTEPTVTSVEEFRQLCRERTASVRAELPDGTTHLVITMGSNDVVRAPKVNKKAQWKSEKKWYKRK